jgi:deazaflavin-dependent oxidoreductase (nitroreductase family)
MCGIVAQATNPEDHAMTDTDTNPETATGGGDEQAWEEALIADLRANGGRPSDGPLKGHPIIVLYSTGAKTGERRRSVLTISTDGDASVVAGTAGGSEHTPAWVANLEAHPDLEFEFGDRTYTGRAEVYRAGAERDRLWDAHVEQLPHFAAYPEQTGRVIPMARIVTTSR